MSRPSVFLVLFLAALLTAPAWAGRGPNYSYGEAWWEEYDNDRQTGLLLHFGRPTLTARAQLATTVQKKKDEEKLGDFDELDEGTKRAGLGVAPVRPGDLGLPPVDDRAVPAGTVLDYSDRRLTATLGPGLRTGPGGRFGDGLHCDGTGALKLKVPGAKALECSFRIERYPAATACLLALAGDESRVLLHPDGRLEFKLKEPHGFPGQAGGNKEPLSPAMLARIMAKPAEIISPDPVPLNAWVHVVVYDLPHPTPGGGEPWDARLKVNGTDVAWYLSERYNDYHHFLGRGSTELVIGNSFAGGQGFVGVLDELRLSTDVRTWYERPALPWRDADATRPLQFNRPFFRSDSTVFHASLDRGLALDLDTAGAKQIVLDLKGEGPDRLRIAGIRGHGWVLDPAIGFPRVPLAGLDVQRGALEFWLRPVNWDDATGYWHHSPPEHKDLTVARFYARAKGGGDPVNYMGIVLPRAYNLEQARVPVDPGHWLHLVAVWDEGGGKWGKLYVNGRRAGGVWRLEPERRAGLTPLYVEFGVPDDVTVKRGEVPRIELDEVVGYSRPLAEDEVQQAQRRWQGELAPIKLYRDDLVFKYSLQRLDYTLKPLLPEGQTPATCVVELQTRDEQPRAVREPLTVALTDGQFAARLHDATPFAPGAYRVRFRISDAAGKELLAGQRDWDYKEEEWRHCQAGVLAKTPAPWTPIQVEGRRLATRMSTYVLGDDGLPAQILADGVELLAAPCRLLEDGAPVQGQSAPPGPSRDVEADWAARFAGRTADLALRCRLEYDGMARWEWRITPKGGPVGRLALEFPLHATHATRYLYYPMGARGVSTGIVGAADGAVLESRVPAAPYQTWRAYVAAREKNPKLQWEAYWGPIRDATKQYGFFGHLSVNDLDRGLYWFCDNAAGWVQSKSVSAIEVVRAGTVVTLRLNFVAEAGEYRETRPLVFGTLPHPARPRDANYRLWQRVDPKVDAKACDIFDAFRPYPMDPKAGNMQIFPAADPKKPGSGPSWEYAQSCIPDMQATKPTGYRTMYLSKAWFSCRAGAYDHWEWRSGDSMAVSLTPWFVNYLCWEMNEWVGRGIWEGIYLDECYEHPAKNLEAGMSVRLPDGSEQPGVTNFQFRELMKRWRNLFTQHGRSPMLMAHLTYSFQYQGIVFCDAYLDGENAPIVQLEGRDWIDSTSKHRYEVLQNGRLWGVTAFYMPFIAEGGFNDKSKSQFPRWQWRMARQAQSQFAQYETATVYEGQGAEVYRAYWRDVLAWGAGDPAVAFVPSWQSPQHLTVEGDDEAQLCFYRKPGKLLIAASNRRKDERVWRVRGNWQELGLPTTPTARDVDSSFVAPAGDDYVPAKTVAKEAEAMLDQGSGSDLLGGNPAELGAAKVEDALTDPTERARREQARLQPRWDAGVLLLPVRGRDFRLISLE